MKSASRLNPWLSLCLLFALVGYASAQAAEQQKPPEQPEVKLPALLSAKPLKIHPKDDELRKLLKARYNEAVSEARDEYEYEEVARKYGPSRVFDPDDLYGIWQRVVVSGLELCDTPAEKIALLTNYLEVTKEAEQIAQRRYDAGKIRSSDLHRARYERLQAEIQLGRAKLAADKPTNK
jgi:hypothetical protein